MLWNQQCGLIAANTLVYTVGVDCQIISAGGNGDGVYLAAVANGVFHPIHIDGIHFGNPLRETIVVDIDFGIVVEAFEAEAEGDAVFLATGKEHSHDAQKQ